MSLEKCPVCDIDCPYCTSDGYCTMEEPFEDCETYWFYTQENL